MKIRHLILIMSFMLMGFTPGKNEISTEYYYNLGKITNSESPRKLRLIRLSNLSKGKTIINEGLLFTYKNRKAVEVSIAGNFSYWKPVKMTRNKQGVWHYYLSENRIAGDIKYKYLVDKIWTTDPKNHSRDDDGAGSYISTVSSTVSESSRFITYKIIRRNLVEFRLYKPNAGFVSIVGDFNNWNPENDLLRKNSNGIWTLQKILPPGDYLYKYVVDGQWIPDIYNQNSSSDITGSLCSVLKLK